MPKFIDIEMAFDFVSGAPYGENRAVYDKVSGEFLYESAMTDEDEIPDFIDPDQYIGIPHKNDLDLGRALVFQFIEQTLPDEEETVYRIFKRPGAYGRFKDFLDRRELLQQWYDFEASAQRKAIERWCEANGLEISSEREEV